VAERAYGIAYWSSPAWLAGARSWLDERLAAAGLQRTGDVRRAHLAPWSAVLCAPTCGGDVWLKAEGPGQAFEVPLLELLCELAPGVVLTPIATDPARAWVLLPDGGEALAERLSGDALADALAGLLPRYAALQLAAAPHAERLLALGVADMRPATLPERFDEALDGVRRFVEAGGRAQDGAAVERIAAMRADVVAWSRRLASAPGTATIDHNDLHARNVLLGDDGDARICDWGDSVVAHPFSSMLVTLSVVRERVLGCCELDDPRLLRVRDAYLEPFAGLAPHAELVQTLELACRLSKVTRALTWQWVLDALDPRDVREEWRRAPLACLESLAGDSYLGAP
jgi:hypothetical protein